MTRNYKALRALAALALAQAASAQQISKPMSALASNSVTGTVICHGGASVPMTSDQEQTLPLHVIATLDCGQQVSYLPATQGYTVPVRTADGKTGYVVWMNLSAASAAPTKQLVRPPAAIKDGVANWVAGTQGSESFYAEGLLVESLTVNGVTVQVSLQDTGWKVLANVAVANNSLAGVQVTPSHIYLSDLGQIKKSLAYQQPEKLKGAVNHQILWAQYNASPSAGASIANADYRSSTRSQDNTQNYLAKHQATVQSVSDSWTGFNPHSQMNIVALKDAVVLPSQQVSGSSWFERDKKLKDVVLRVPVGDTVYEFPFTFNQNK